MYSIIPTQELSAQQIKYLRSISSLGISEIKQAALKQKSIRNIEEFGSNWDSEKSELFDIYKNYLSKNCGFKVIDSTDLDEAIELLPEELLETLKGLREIELQTERKTQLELGYIKDPSEFKTEEEDWTA